MINTVTLERMTFAAQQHISKSLADDFGNLPDVSVLQDHIYGGLTVQVRQFVYGEHLDQRTVRYPATWRDAVKDRLYAWLRFGHWPYGADLLEARWPVLWQEVTIDVTALYPKISMPYERHTLKIAQFQDTKTESQRLWFDAQKMGLNNAVYELCYHGRGGEMWHVGHTAYRALMDMRDGNGTYLIMPSVQQLLGMPVKDDPLVPLATVELRNKQDQLIGKIYNIGTSDST